MVEKTSVSKKGFTADWLVRGLLTKVGDSVDKLTGRRWTPSSSIAASQLVERIKKLLDAEAKDVPGKGKVVPHNIKLKMQWNKFSEDAEESLKVLETELLAAAVDHINDSLYYTYAPVTLEVKPDYFIEGVKLMAGFEKFTDEDREVELNVTVPAINVAEALAQVDAGKPRQANDACIARYQLKGASKETRIEIPPAQSVSIGRTGVNALMLDDQSVSKIHASLAVSEDGALMISDTGSTNGTFINDERIAYGKAMRLEAGDRVKFGLIEVAFEHLPRPLVLEAEAAGDEGPAGDTVEIGGFEFKRRESPEAPEDDGNETAAAVDVPAASDTSPAIAMPETPVTESTSASIEVPEEPAAEPSSPAIAMPEEPVAQPTAQEASIPDETMKLDTTDDAEAGDGSEKA